MAIGMNKATDHLNEIAHAIGATRQIDALTEIIDGGAGSVIEAAIEIIGVGEMTPATESAGTETILLTRGESLEETAETGL